MSQEDLSGHTPMMQQYVTPVFTGLYG